MEKSRIHKLESGEHKGAKEVEANEHKQVNEAVEFTNGKGTVKEIQKEATKGRNKGVEGSSAF